MKTSSKNPALAGLVAGLFFALVMVAQTAYAQPTLDETIDATLIDPPTDGTFWLLSGVTGDSLPPFPFNPCGDAPVYLLTNGQFLVDDSAVLISTDSFATLSVPELPPDDGGGSGGTNDPHR